MTGKAPRHARHLRQFPEGLRRCRSDVWTARIWRPALPALIDTAQMARPLAAFWAIVLLAPRTME